MIIVGDQVATETTPVSSGEIASGVLQARVATNPMRRMSSRTSGPPGSMGVTGVMGHPAVSAGALAESAVCLFVGTRMPLMTAVGPVEGSAGVGASMIGSAPPYLSCTHIDSDDLRDLAGEDC